MIIAKASAAVEEIDVQQPTVAYLLNTFPALSETFIQQEMLELERQGLALRAFAIAAPSGKGAAWHGQAPVMYLAQQPLRAMLAALVKRLVRQPGRVWHAARAMFGNLPPRAALGHLVRGAFLADQLEREGITRLHAHYASEPASIAYAASLLSAIPFSFTAHAYDIYLTPRAQLAAKLRAADFVATCTEYNRAYLQEVGGLGSAPINRIYHGLNLRLFADKVKQDSPASTNVPLILVVARLVEKKGLTYLLQACRQLRDQGYDFTCRIIGEGPLREQLAEEIHALDLADCVTLCGALPHSEVIAHYTQAAIMALPCVIADSGDRDGIPNVLVEAQAMGVPVVSTTVSAIPELIASESNGLLVPPHDAPALAAALARLIGDSELRARFAAAGKLTVADRFDMAANTTRLLGLLQGKERVAVC